MATVRDVARELGLSERTVQRWVAALRQHLDGAIRQERRRVILSDDAVSLLRQIRQLRDSGMSLSQAIEKTVGNIEIKDLPKLHATADDAATSPRRQSRQCDVVDVVVATSCAVGALSLVAIAVALWLR